MKDNLPRPVEFGIRIIVFLCLIFISLIIDSFSFGMMNPQNAVFTGLGVSLFLGNNIVMFMSSYKIVKPIFTKLDEYKN